jgi:hypothetical protein
MQRGGTDERLLCKVVTTLLLLHRFLCRRCIRSIAADTHLSALRGRLHVFDSACESPYDSVHDLLTKGLRF